MDTNNAEFEFHKTKRYTNLSCRQRATPEIYMTFCGVEQCIPGAAVGPRVRNNYHLHVILSGKGTLEVGGRVHHLHANQAFLLKPRETVYYVADREDPWYYCWVSFNGPLAEKYMDAAGFTEGVNTRDCFVDAQEFFLLVQKLLECTEMMVYNEPRRLGLTLEFISLMMESDVRGERACRRRHDYSPDVYVEHAVDMIHLNYNKVRICDIAQYIGINRSYLTSIFKRKMGVSPQEYLLRYRLNVGRHLLLTTSLSIQEIAQKIGYDNPLTFSKIFKNAYGVSPRNFRLQGGHTIEEPPLPPLPDRQAEEHKDPE